MSLIDEALKRAREQTTPPDPAGGPPAVPPEDPWSYAPLPDRRRVGRELGPLAAVAGGIVLLGGAAWFLWRPGAPETRRPAPAPAGMTARSAQENARPSDSAAAPAAPVAPAREGATRGGPTRADGSASGIGQPQERAPRDGRGGASPPLPVVLSAGIASESPRPAAANRSRTLLPTEGQGPAERRSSAGGGKAHSGSFVAQDGTRIELGGIVFSETNPVALINGRVLPVGGVVGSMTIVAITESRVELAGDGAGSHVFLSLR